MTGTLSLGVATADISPPLGLALSGWDGDRHGRSLHASLSCRALHLSDGTATAAIVTLDVLGLAASCAGEIRAEIERRVGIPRGAVLLAASHTHSGPVLPPWWLPGIDRPDEHYLDELGRTVVKTVAAAASRPRPVLVGYGRASCSLGVSRRLPWDGGRVGYPPHADPNGAVDDEVGVLRFDSLDGTPVAVLFSYGCHPTVGGPSEWIGPDYPGQARRLVESYHPNAVAAFLLGNCGDVRPGYMLDDGSFRWQVPSSLVDAAGARLGARVLEAMADARPAGDAVLRVGRAERDVFCTDGSLASRCEFGALRLGDVAVVTNPAETFCEIGLEVRARTSLPLLFASLTNGALGYVPTDSAYTLGGYEVELSYRGYGLAAPIRPDAHHAFRDGMLEALAATRSQ